MNLNSGLDTFELNSVFFKFELSKVAEGLTVETILESWLKLKPTIMSEWNEDKDLLVDLFGRVRDEWMDNDLSSWIGANRYGLKHEISSSIVCTIQISTSCIPNKS